MLLGDDIYSNGCKIRGLIVDKGTSFPGSPVAGQLFYRTDLATLNAWDGAAWQVQADTDYVDSAVAGVGGFTDTIKTANYTAVAGDRVIVNNSTGTDITILLPASPATGAQVSVVVESTSGAGRVIVGGNGNTFTDGSTDVKLGSPGAAITVVWTSGTGHWATVAQSYQGRKVAENIGDGATNPVTVSHGLGTLDVSVQVVEIATGETVDATVIRTTIDAVTVGFAVTATADQYRVIVQG